MLDWKDQLYLIRSEGRAIYATEGEIFQLFTFFERLIPVTINSKIDYRKKENFDFVTILLDTYSKIHKKNEYIMSLIPGADNLKGLQ